MFIFKNNTKLIGIGLIVLSVVMLYAIGNSGLLRFRHLEIALFIVGSIIALRYKEIKYVPKVRLLLSYKTKRRY
jgi:hypothetical protein